MEQYNPYFSGSVPNDPAAADRLTRMYESGTQARLREIEDRMKLGKAQIAGSYREALLRSGDARLGIEEAREYHRGQLEQARQEMERLNIPDMEIRRFVAEHNYEIAKGELEYKKDLAQAQIGDYASQDRARQADAAYKMGVLQQARDEMLQMGIPKMLVDRYVAETTAAYQQGQLGLTRDQMEQIGIPAMLTDRYSAEAQAAYQQGQLGLTAQQQQQTATEQQRRYALDVAKYGTELASTPDRYFQAQQFAAQAPRLLGLQAGAGPAGGPTPGINQMGSLLARATEGLEHQATPYQLPGFPTAPAYTPPPVRAQPGFPTMPAYTAPPLGPVPTFPGFAGAGPATPPVAQPGVPQGGVPDMGAGPNDENYLLHTQGGVPGHAAGGWVGLRGPELGWLGEQGPEYVVPNGGNPMMAGGGDQSALAAASARQYGGYGGDTLYAGGGGAFDESGGAYGFDPAAYKTGVYHLPGYQQPAATAREPDLSALGPDEQARYRQLMARRAQILASGGPGLDGPDVGELQRYQARVRQPRYPTGTGTYGGPTAGARPTYAGGPQAPPASSYGAGDPREKQLAQIAKASPPSPFDGLSDTDQATLRLMQSIYSKGGQAIQGGELERLGPSQKGFMKSAGSLLGYDYNDLERSYAAYRPAQGSAALAG